MSYANLMCLVVELEEEAFDLMEDAKLCWFRPIKSARMRGRAEACCDIAKEIESICGSPRTVVRTSKTGTTITVRGV